MFDGVLFIPYIHIHFRIGVNHVYVLSRGAEMSSSPAKCRPNETKRGYFSIVSLLVVLQLLHVATKVSTGIPHPIPISKPYPAQSARETKDREQLLDIATLFAALHSTHT